MMILSLADIIRIASFGAHEAGHQALRDLDKNMSELNILNKELQEKSQKLKELLGVRSRPLSKDEKDKKETVKELGTIVDEIGNVSKLFSRTVGIMYGDIRPDRSRTPQD